MQDLKAAILGADPVALANGHRIELGGGYSLLLTFEPDCDSELPETYGTVEYCYGRDNYRPDGFDGSAEKIHLQSATYWWLPYREGRKVYKDCRAAVATWLEYGPTGAILTLKGPATSPLGTFHSVTIETVSLWGLEPLDDHIDAISELQAELAFVLSRFNHVHP